MSVFDLLSVALSLAAIVAYHLMMRSHVLRWLGRVGAGIAVAAIILTLVERIFPDSPFRDWAWVMLRLGLVLLFASLARSGGAMSGGRKASQLAGGHPSASEGQIKR